MAVEQLPGQVREFASYLSGLMKRLDQDGGWCAVFWQRDPDGMRACLDGWEVPPWDVVEALLQDLAAEQGPQAVAQEAQRARSLHGASLTAYDGRPGGRDALGDRLDVMLREQRYSAERQAELSRQLHAVTTQEEADTVRIDLAWAHDDHERATARCAELRHRMENLDRRALRTHVSGAFDFSGDAGGGVVRVAEPADQRALETRPGAPGTAAPDRPTIPPERSGPRPRFADPAASDRSGPAPAPTAPRDPATPGSGPFDPAAARSARSDSAAARTGPYDQAGTSTTPSTSASATANLGAAPGPGPAPAPSAAPVPKQRSRRRPRGSARFAGMMEAEAAPVAVPETAAPPVSAPAVPSGRSPRGARFAGAAEAPAQPRTEVLDEDARRATAETVQTLTRLRREGRSGEAHAVLVEAAYWPAARFPLLAAELHRAGLDADWATLLWEAASLPADRLVGAADALVAAGRSADGRQMLRQGVARPAPEIGTAVLSLADGGRQREIRALLDAYVRVRTPEEAARSAEADPGRLVPLLLAAAKGVSEERHWDLVHALRVAGFTA
ncbi:hypothetical protein [Streptomyces olivochromogenes]|uniref:UL36 very large tegument protein n=1 Tax=Streptomyces olivochromogenes TaxID=1963 RepID=A0A250V2X5_STROL|nr:hypothetical protein [Streptomyces olivochromogenes]KUN48710.1 hypothetical protein AQJ27_05830 [Streptomyces olivochromogenes]GAX48547.1 hypothetical protein SO3561_00027 [Streptomyces olivochromogenes]